MKRLCNKCPAWAAYRRMMGCRMLALDKVPGVHPLGVGEVWRQAITKCALKACREDAKAACSSTNLCAGLEAGIEGALHAVSKRSEAESVMDFGNWEVDNDLFQLTAKNGKTQDSLPMWRVKEAQEIRRAAAAAVEQQRMRL